MLRYLNKNFYLSLLLVLSPSYLAVQNLDLFHSFAFFSEVRSSDLGRIDSDRDVYKSFEADDKPQLGIPTTPFELIDIIKKSSAMDDATIPSDAIDEALKGFNTKENVPFK